MPKHLHAIAALSLLVACGGGGGGTKGPRVGAATLGQPTVADVTQTGAQVAASVTADGGGTVSARGVVWGPNANPTVADGSVQSGSGTGSFTASLAGLSAGTSYHIRAYATNPAGTAYSADVSFKTLPPDSAPVITSAPASVTVAPGATATFHVAATGNPSPTFRWEACHSADVWEAIAGATSDTYITPVLALGDDGMKVRARAENRAGSATSDPAILRVVTQVPPSITLQPADQVATLGSPVRFTAAAAGSPAPSCQWQRSDDAGNTWTELQGATAFALDLTPGLSDDGALFRAVATNAHGVAPSQAARLAVRNADGTPVLDAGHLAATVEALKLTIPSFTSPGVRSVTPAQYLAERPAASLPFEAGFVDANGAVVVTDPAEPAQRAVFRNAQQVADFCLAQAMLRQWYATDRIPLWLSTGFASYIARIRPDTARLRAEVAGLGRKPTLAELEDPAFYMAHQGLDFSATFGEWIHVFYGSMVLRWDLRANADGTLTLNIGQNVRTRDDLTRVWHLLLDGFHLDTTNQRIALREASAQVDYWYADADADLIPEYRRTLEATLTTYLARMEVTPKARFSFLLMPNRPMHSEWAGWTYDPSGYSVGGGGVAGFRMVSPHATPMGDNGVGLMKHEFAHTIQMQVYAEFMPAWLSEGFPDALENAPFSTAAIAQRKAQVQTAMTKATAFYGHRPTYDEMGAYTNVATEYNYYDLGPTMVDFMVRTWGWKGVKDLIATRGQDPTVLGVVDKADFMTRYYADYDQIWNQ